MMPMIPIVMHSAGANTSIGMPATPAPRVSITGSSAMVCAVTLANR